ncbi:MAG: mismatch-specific DNA-glycosylase [Dehalococcoidia bacterium]|nr:mismatch-specific DNA-glycosylase [Dehalococcoidia bacterium]
MPAAPPRPPRPSRPLRPLGPPRTLPDLLRPDLTLVFAGINPGVYSARASHYYAHPGNGFWRALAGAAVEPADDRRLPLDCGISFTDVVKRVVTDSTEVSARALRAAFPAFRRRIAYARPRALCFTTTRAFDALFPGLRAPGAWGRQPAVLEGAELWAMPSTSGRAAARRDEVHRVLTELARSLAPAHGAGPAAR